MVRPGCKISGEHCKMSSLLFSTWSMTFHWNTIKTVLYLIITRTEKSTYFLFPSIFWAPGAFVKNGSGQSMLVLSPTRENLDAGFFRLEINNLIHPQNWPFFLRRTCSNKRGLVCSLSLLEDSTLSVISLHTLMIFLRTPPNLFFATNIEANFSLGAGTELMYGINQEAKIELL